MNQRPFISTNLNIFDENRCVFSPSIIGGQPVMISQGQNRKVCDTLTTAIANNPSNNCCYNQPNNGCYNQLNSGYYNQPNIGYYGQPNNCYYNIQQPTGIFQQPNAIPQQSMCFQPSQPWPCSLQAQKQGVQGGMLFNFAQPNYYVPPSCIPSVYTPPPPPSAQITPFCCGTPQAVCADFGRFGPEAMMFQQRCRKMCGGFTYDKQVGTNEPIRLLNDNIHCCGVQAVTLTADQKQEMFQRVDQTDTKQQIPTSSCDPVADPKKCSCFPKPQPDKYSSPKTLVIGERKERTCKDYDASEQKVHEADAEAYLCCDCFDQWKEQNKDKKPSCLKKSGHDLDQMGNLKKCVSFELQNQELVISEDNSNTFIHPQTVGICKSQRCLMPTKQCNVYNNPEHKSDDETEIENNCEKEICERIRKMTSLKKKRNTLLKAYSYLNTDITESLKRLDNDINELNKLEELSKEDDATKKGTEISTEEETNYTSRKPFTQHEETHDFENESNSYNKKNLDENSSFKPDKKMPYSEKNKGPQSQKNLNSTNKKTVRKSVDCHPPTKVCCRCQPFEKREKIEIKKREQAKLSKKSNDENMHSSENEHIETIKNNKIKDHENNNTPDMKTNTSNDTNNITTDKELDNEDPNKELAAPTEEENALPIKQNATETSTMEENVHVEKKDDEEAQLPASTEEIKDTEQNPFEAPNSPEHLEESSNKNFDGKVKLEETEIEDKRDTEQDERNTSPKSNKPTETESKALEQEPSTSKEVTENDKSEKINDQEEAEVLFERDKVGNKTEDTNSIEPATLEQNEQSKVTSQDSDHSFTDVEARKANKRISLSEKDSSESTAATETTTNDLTQDPSRGRRKETDMARSPAQASQSTENESQIKDNDKEADSDDNAEKNDQENINIERKSKCECCKCNNLDNDPDNTQNYENLERSGENSTLRRCINEQGTSDENSNYHPCVNGRSAVGKATNFINYYYAACTGKLTNFLLSLRNPPAPPVTTFPNCNEMCYRRRIDDYVSQLNPSKKVCPCKVGTNKFCGRTVYDAEKNQWNSCCSESTKNQQNVVTITLKETAKRRIIRLQNSCKNSQYHVIYE